MVATQLEVADPFAELGSRAEDFEMIRGVLREAEAMGGRHGEVGGDLHGHLWVFVKGHDLGVVFNSDTQYEVIPIPRTVLKPDVSFVARHESPSRPGAALFRLPDFAAQVASPSNRQVRSSTRSVSTWKAGHAWSGLSGRWIVR